MAHREIIEDIVVLLRGFFSTPVISSLGRLGILRTIRLASSFTVDDFSNIPNRKLLQDTFRYLMRLGLLEKMDGLDETYRVSELGKEIFRRSHSFYVPHSYSEYLHRYHELIQNPHGKIECEVERLENVIGSGITHQRYFPPVVSFLRRKADFDVMVDIGCGDGQFLNAFVKAVPGKEVVGIDISRVSTETTYRNLREQFPQLEVTVICSDALDVKKWGEEVIRMAGSRRIAISMWFLIHEISGNMAGNLIGYFRNIHDLFPYAPIVVGELVCQSDDIVLQNNLKSLMPEYLFFHEMSGQGILLWDEYHEMLDNIPYELAFERLFDEMLDHNGRSTPSTFVWGLLPK